MTRTVVWFPATEAVTRLTRPLGHPKLAMDQLCRDIRSKGSKRLPAATRCIGSETFERLKPSKLESFSVESLLEANAAEIGVRPDDEIIDGGVFGPPEEQSAAAPTTECWLFVDLARFEKLHPDAAASAGDLMPLRRPPGPKPTGDWYMVLAKWLIRVTYEDSKQLENVDTLVLQAQAFLTGEIGWAPEEPKILRRKIVELLELTRR
jgi:hypothetical protein